MKKRVYLIIFAVIFIPVASLAEPVQLATPVELAGPVELGEEYVEHSKPEKAEVKKKKSKTTLEHIVLYIPNRLLDLVDIVRADVGVGSSFGAVVRVSEYAQVAYRSVAPVSFRAGPRGRKLPFFAEHSSEIGIGPNEGPLYLKSGQREVTPLEVGVGADLFLVGAYAGISVDEIFDFLGGLVFIDFKDDDL